MARQLNQTLWDQWRQRIERQRESGLSIAAFCRRENCSRQGFHIWRRKFRKATLLRQAPRRDATVRSRRERRGAIPSRRGSDRFANSAASPRPVEFLQLPVSAARSSPWIELALADGTVLRLPPQNVAALLAVVRVLRGESVDIANAEHDDA